MPIPNLWQPLICPPFLKCYHFKKLYNWNHTVCNLLWLDFFTQPTSSKFIQVVCFNRLFLFIPEWVYHKLVKHLPKGHPGWFQFGAITNKTTMNTRVCRDIGRDILRHSFPTNQDTLGGPVWWNPIHFFRHNQQSFYHYVQYYML